MRWQENATKQKSPSKLNKKHGGKHEKTSPI